MRSLKYLKNRTFLSPKKLFWQFVTLLGLTILFASPLTSALQMAGVKRGVEMPTAVSLVQASEIYAMFSCPCCGQPLNKEEPCCGAMTQMVDYIDEKISAGATKEDVMLATAQEFGLERLISEDDREAMRAQLLARAPKDAPRIVVTEVKRDLGEVSQRDGVVTTEFIIKNEGKSDLVIDKLSSSCGCTSGSVIYQDEEGPRFYMTGHGYDEADPNWSVVISAGDEAKVKIYYDPSVHPDLIGSVTRTLSVHSNDPVDFETKLTITLEQI